MTGTQVKDSLLSSEEPPAVVAENEAGTGPFMIVCDHASNRLPKRIGSLGVSPDVMQSHIAWDPGALIVAQGLSESLDSPLVWSGYSRLVIDLNRPPQSPGSISTISAGTSIPGNADLAEEARLARVSTLFIPYHNAISTVLDERSARRRRTLLVAMHSFTPDYPGETRPWQIGVTYRHDRGLGAGLVRTLRRLTALTIGDNEPFRIDDVGDVTIPRHGEARRLPNVLIELRQDTLATDRQRREWIDILTTALKQSDPDRVPSERS